MLKKVAVVSVLATLMAVALSVSMAEPPEIGAAQTPASKPKKKAKSAENAAAAKIPNVEKDALKLIPADCIGFVAVNDVENAAEKLDDMLNKIVPIQVKPMMFPQPVFDMIKRSISLGDDFRDNGTFLAMILDPRKYAPKSLKAEQENNETAEKEPFPGVFVIPANGFENLLTRMTFEKKDDYYSFDSEGWAMIVGKHVVMSQNAACRDAFKSIKSLELPEDVSKAMAANDASAWLNIKALGEIAKLAPEKTATSKPNPIKEMFSSPDVFLTEAEYGYAGVIMSEQGPVITGKIHYPADSISAKILSACKATDKSILTLLPQANTIMAFGMVEGWQKPADAVKKEIESMLEQPPFKDLSKEEKEKIAEVMKKWNSLNPSCQMFVGSASEGPLPVGLSCVVKCESAEDALAVIRDSSDVTKKILAEALKKAVEEQHSPIPMPDFSNVELQYKKDAETIGNVKADEIYVDIPAMGQMSPQETSNMEAILGEAKLRLLVAVADKQKLVITFCGGKEMMESALKAAAKPQDGLDVNSKFASAFAKLPKQKIAVGLFDVGNFVNTMLAVTRTTSPGSVPPMADITQQPPVVFSVSTDKSDLVMTGFIPTDSLEEIFKQIAAGMMPGASGDGDF